MDRPTDIPESVITDGRLIRVPNAPKTPLRCFRVPTDLYQAAQQVARAEGRSVSDIVRECLLAYVQRKLSDDPKPDGDGES